jgi:methylated-DNA-protein-cysteine methyltransferase-like protein
MKRQTPVFEQVRLLVRRIPRGRVATYGQLSEMLDGRLSPVGIGWALHGAPPGACPWHRVVNARGGISTESEAPGLQRAMLESEGVRFGSDGCVDLATQKWRPRRAARRRP